MGMDLLRQHSNYKPIKLTTDATRAPNLQELINRIQERDKQLELYAKSNWLLNGRDLLTAKEIVGHGNFQAWCDKNIHYSKSKAEKLMRAAELIGPYFKSVSVTDLPPATVVYTISGRSVPQEIRDKFIPLIIAGKDVRDEVKTAIKDHRARTEQTKKAPEEPAEALIAGSSDEIAQDRKSEAQAAEGFLPTVALSDAVALIVDRFDGDLSALLVLLDQAGQAAVFTPAAEHLLRDHVTASATPQTSIEPAFDEAVDPRI